MEQIKFLFLLLFILPIFLSCEKETEDEYISTLPPTKKICFVGNSLTYWGNWADLTGDTLCKNYGIGGNTTNDILKRISPLVDENPCAIFLMIGINDIRRDYDINSIEKNIATIIKKIKRRLPHTQIYLQSILPINPDVSTIVLPHQIPNIAELNQRLEQLCKEESITYIYLYPDFCNDENKLQPEITYDGLHLLEKGYEIWIDCLKPYLNNIRKEYPV